MGQRRAGPVDRLRVILTDGLPSAGSRGRYPAAVVAVAHAGRSWRVLAVGETVRYADRAGTLLPAGQRPPATATTIFDLASLTKLFTATLLLRLVEAGAVDLDVPVDRWLPELSGRPSAALTARQLVRHTAGLPALCPGARSAPDPDTAWRMVAATKPSGPPDRLLCYSDVGLIMLGVLVERAAGAGGAGPPGSGLARLVRDQICRPLGLADTGYLPKPRLRDRIAATEVRPGGRVCHGEVHDETAYALGGVSGHAGLFGTAGDLLRFGEMLRQGGTLDGVRVLDGASVAAMTRDQVPAGVRTSGFSYGLGVRLADPGFMGPLAGSAFGHSGFTGTSLVVDPERELTIVLLTNRVHPDRAWSSVEVTRRAVCAAVLEATAG